MYKDENINKTLANLQRILLELKNKGYRFEWFIKEYAHTASQEEKEIGEELVLTKVLQQLIATQIKNMEGHKRQESPVQK